MRIFVLPSDEYPRETDTGRRTAPRSFNCYRSRSNASHYMIAHYDTIFEEI